MARKHITQFSPIEKAFGHGYLRKHAGKIWSVRGHFVDRATERTFSFEDARKVIAGGLIVEIHNDRGEYRALVRNAAGVCVVVSLDTLELITVYYNAPDDKHETLNHALYHGGKTLDVVNIVKSLRG